jgi:uncharacterized protein
MVTCPHCSAQNRPGSPFCDACWRILDAPAAPAPVAAVQTVRMVPPPPPPPFFGTPAFAGMPAVAAPAYPAFASPAASTSLEPIKWRWPHLWFFGLFAWTIPTLFLSGEQSGGATSGLISKALIVQLVCYLLAGMAAYVLVSKFQGGDWSTLGLTFSDLSYSEVLRGGAFGLVLIAAWLPVGFLFSGGKMRFDELIQALIGGTTGPGLLLAMLVVVVGAPIIEEIYYRGMLYEKLARRSRGLAIVGTSVLFVSAHGALIIPALMILAFGLAWKRATEGLWFTIAAHATWNLVVMIVAAFVLLGPAHLFTPTDASYSVRHPANWQRAEEMEMSAPGVSMDLALAGPNGSFIGIARVDLPPSSHIASKRVKNLLTMMQGFAGQAGIAPARPTRSHAIVGGLTGGAYEVRNQFTEPTTGMAGEMVQVAAVPPGWSKAVVFQFACPTNSCAESAPDFEQMMSSFTPGPGL